jgi:dynein heavy chain
MIKLYIRQFDTKSKEFSNKRNRLVGGLDKLQKASVQVTDLEIMLKDLQPELEKQSVLLAKALKDVEIDSRKAGEIEAIVSIEADDVARQKNEVQVLA